MLQRPAGVDRFGSRVGSAEKLPPVLARGWWDDYTRGTNRRVRQHPVVRLTEDGIDWGAKPRPGDQVGYAMDPYATDDCFAAAIATATQTAIEEVPDLRLDERVELGEDPDLVGRWSIHWSGPFNPPCPECRERGSACDVALRLTAETT